VATNPYSPPVNESELEPRAQRVEPPPPIALWKAVLRWVLVPVVVAGAFCVTMAVGVFAWLSVNAWCPWGRGTSYSCSMPTWAEFGLYSVTTAATAVLMLVLGTLTAPSRRAPTAWAIFGGGAVLALGVGLNGPSSLYMVPALSAIGVGLLVTVALSLRFSAKPTSVER
jgi:hypothetical protein